jgi:hypothetical protein
VVVLQELNYQHADWLQQNLLPDWCMAGAPADGLHVLWDNSELVQTQCVVRKVFPDAGHDDRYRYWRRCL